MTTQAQAVALTKRYRDRLKLIASQARDAGERAWDRLGSWDEADVDTFDRLTRPVVVGAARTSAALTAGYLGILLGSTVAVDLERFLDQLDPRGAFVAYWSSLKRGDPWDQAVTVGRTNAGTYGFGASQGAARDTSQQADDTQPRITGWERVLVGVSCEFCATVATQRYHSAESASFGHDRCDCAVVPIIGSTSPGRVINRGLLDAIKNQGDAATGYVNPDGSPTERPSLAPVEAP